MTREIDVCEIISAVAALSIDSCCKISKDIKRTLDNSFETEKNDVAKSVLSQMLENAKIAEADLIPICQDTGQVVVIVEIGQDVHISGGPLEDAINEGVRQGYANGFLRKSVVACPLRRENTKDNTPAVIHYEIVQGEKLTITVSPKGFGSENMSRHAMLKPSAGLDGVKKFIVETVKIAGPNPCPPIIVGVGIGGTFEKSALIAKKALMREIGTKNDDAFLNALEEELLKEINALNICPAGLGGELTAMAVHINTFATHIAGLPVAVNIGCHVTRHLTVNL